ncbi:MAG: GNAT family N-acetyltransferase [Chitinophagaceae bacterium]
MPEIIFETERLLVRRFTLEDTELFHRLNSEEAIIRYIRPAKSRQENDTFLQDNLHIYQQTPAYGRWAMLLKQTGEMVGTFAVFPLDNTEEIQLGYALFPEHWGQGFATESTQGGITYVFEQLKLPYVVAVTEAANIASQKVLLNTGFAENSTYERGGKQLKKFIKHNSTSFS